MAKASKTKSHRSPETQGFRSDAPPLDVTSICEGAELHGLTHAAAKRLATIVENILTDGGQGSISTSDIMTDAGPLADLHRDGPRPIKADEGNAPSGVMLLANDDAVLLARTVALLLTPRYISGRDWFARFSRDGPPSKLALDPPKEAPFSPGDLQEILKRRKDSK